MSPIGIESVDSMSDLISSSTTKSDDLMHPVATLQPSDWLRSLSFSDALRQSIILLQGEFQWLILVFFLGGTGLALLLLPVNTIIEALANLIFQEMMSFPPNFDALLNLLTTSLFWGSLQTFVTFFGIFLMNAVAIHRVLKTHPTLEIMAKNSQAPHFPSLQIIGAGLITSGLTTVANLFVVLVPVVLLLCYFVPAVLVIEGGTMKEAFSQSFQMRHKHVQRILGAILLGATFLVFAHTLGVHVYLSLEFLFQLYGASLGIASLVALIILTQIPVSMVAPLIPLLSVAFYSGARGARAEHRYEKFTRAVRRQRARTASLKLLDASQSACRHCGNPLRPDSAFCSRCGTPTTLSPASILSEKE